MPKPAALAPQLGQLIILGFDGTEMSPRIRSLLARIQPAGVILFARNIVAVTQTHQLLKYLRACVETPLFCCVDLEGGRVDRFRDVLGPTPAAADVFATHDRRLFRTHGRIVGECCRALGFNTDFAPVVDLAFETSRKVMNSRTVSDDPRQVVVYAREFLAGLQSAAVLGAVKHFPGLGEASLDTHLELPSVTRSWRKLWEQDLAPYRALRRDAPMVLVGHAAYPMVTGDRMPASLSEKWIRGVLRKKIGYRGLVLSDDLEMGGVLKAAPIEQAAVQHIKAGGDMCLICHVEDHIVAAYEELVREAERDRRFARRCQESVAHILAFKKKCEPLRRRTAAPSASRVQALSRHLWELSEQVRLQNIDRDALERQGRP